MVFGLDDAVIMMGLFYLGGKVFDIFAGAFVSEGKEAVAGWLMTGEQNPKTLRVLYLTAPTPERAQEIRGYLAANLGKLGIDAAKGEGLAYMESADVERRQNEAVLAQEKVTGAQGLVKKVHESDIEFATRVETERSKIAETQLAAPAKAKAAKVAARTETEYTAAETMGEMSALQESFGMIPREEVLRLLAAGKFDARPDLKAKAQRMADLDLAERAGVKTEEYQAQAASRIASEQQAPVKEPIPAESKSDAFGSTELDLKLIEQDPALSEDEKYKRRQQILNRASMKRRLGY